MNNQSSKVKTIALKLSFLLCGIGAMSSCNQKDEMGALEKEDQVVKGSSARTAVSIANNSFESSWSSWSDTDPSSISGEGNSGSKSAKITGAGGKFTQEVDVQSNTTYELAAYVKGGWRIAAYVNGVKTSRSGTASSWKQEVVTFSTGNASTVTIAGEYNSSEGRFDDFTLASTDEETTPPTANEQLAIASVSASANDGNVPANTIDGSLSTRWSANGNGQWILYDLGSVKNISSVKIAWFKGNLRSSTFEVLTGDATTDLSVVHSGVSSGSSLELEEVSLSNVSGRYLKIIGYGNSSNTWNSITETEIYGTDGEGEGVDPTDPVEPTDPPSNGGEYPYDILNLQGWKLNAFSGTLNSPKFVDNTPNLDTYSNDNWFFTDGEWVSFKCYAGYPTSSGSGNPRTELREMNSSGSDEIEWDGDSGTNRMEWKVRVDQLPSSGKVCFGQIHGPSDTYDDVIRVQFQGDPNQSSGAVRLKIMGWVTEKNDDNEGDFIDGNWTVGGEMHFRLIFENTNVVLYNISSSGSATEIYRFNGCGSNGNYFKAGTYLQSMKGKSLDTSDFGQVSISYLNITH
ncbi:polysaccharide lyase family 7 protein [Flammeovirga kamogawensis]|uniref:Polysaccharide lyase family 7 protein n=1 Tax=Flammeovirga kamogawensis TaxID=373891 RepID=A0ABX8GV11_9BACT|nr:polysaccharide lyase family 7 protein [Flammeovirga kamogawensis]MBB6459695.1 hypothetical protein [Flammeovirga kamogawensis]QWG07244.1 polysaccharide lyase family 7 protein [Flammeovirga kamogawensis]TRX69064.1 hypothetical protein EO216_13360 [Flammeovirga kamogawensis]